NVLLHVVSITIILNHTSNNLTSQLTPFHIYDPHTTHIHTLSLHDALPISLPEMAGSTWAARTCKRTTSPARSRIASPTALTKPRSKSTRLNSSHVSISYAVFCLKKKNKLLSYIYI